MWTFFLNKFHPGSVCTADVYLFILVEFVLLFFKCYFLFIFENIIHTHTTYLDNTHLLHSLFLAPPCVCVYMDIYVCVYIFILCGLMHVYMFMSAYTEAINQLLLLYLGYWRISLFSEASFLIGLELTNLARLAG